jgi:hypothetical protein
VVGGTVITLGQSDLAGSPIGGVTPCSIVSGQAKQTVTSGTRHRADPALAHTVVRATTETGPSNALYQAAINHIVRRDAQCASTRTCLLDLIIDSKHVCRRALLCLSKDMQTTADLCTR